MPSLHLWYKWYLEVCVQHPVTTQQGHRLFSPASCIHLLALGKLASREVWGSVPAWFSLCPTTKVCISSPVWMLPCSYGGIKKKKTIEVAFVVLGVSGTLTTVIQRAFPGIASRFPFSNPHLLEKMFTYEKYIIFCINSYIEVLSMFWITTWVNYLLHLLYILLKLKCCSCIFNEN